MKVALRTNVRMMQGAAQWERYRGSRMFPAMQLVRIEQRIEKRDWRRRWSKAAAPYGAEVSVSRMIAPHGHPIWRDISRFGLPYPPYDFMSGMGQMPVRVDEAKQYIDLDAPFEQSEAESLNSMLAVSPRVNSKKLRAALSEHLKGYARWQGNKLVFTDPNGTSPIYGDDLAKVWEQGLPEGFENGQMKAFIEWVRDSSGYYIGSKRKDLQPNTDMYEDFVRLVSRLKNKTSPKELWRGMAMTKHTLADFLKTIKKGGYTPRDFQPADSWTLKKIAAKGYTAEGDMGSTKWSVYLRVKGARKAKDVTPLVRMLEKKIAYQKTPTVAQDAEWLYSRGERLQVISVSKDVKRKVVTVELEEADK